MNRVYMVHQFMDELKKLFRKSKSDLKKYIPYLISQLQILERTDRHIAEYPFEKLSDHRADLYRIKSKSSRKNVRVIYYYRKDETIVLLCAMEEKSSSDYDRGIDSAIKRIKMIEKGESEWTQ